MPVETNMLHKVINVEASRWLKTGSTTLKLNEMIILQFCMRSLGSNTQNLTQKNEAFKRIKIQKKKQEKKERKKISFVNVLFNKMSECLVRTDTKDIPPFIFGPSNEIISDLYYFLLMRFCA